MEDKRKNTSFDRSYAMLDKLKATYPAAQCELSYDTPFHLLVSVILSAQCTDKRVNQVTPELFKTYSTPKDFAEADTGRLESLIYSCGFYHNKARNIIGAARDIEERFGGEVPDSFDDLLSLSGVGRKTANVMMAVAFGGDNIAVDTHVFRLSHRLGLSDGKTPYDVERDLRARFEPKDYSAVHHLLIFHGRYCCKSRRPQCAECPVSEFCVYSPAPIE